MDTSLNPATAQAEQVEFFSRIHHDDWRVLVGQLFLDVLSKGGIDRHPCTHAMPFRRGAKSKQPWLGNAVKDKNK